MKIAFIGAGNMARSLIGGMVDGDAGTAAANIAVTDVIAAVRDKAASDFGVEASDSNNSAAAGAALVVLAVKPQQMREVVSGLQGHLGGKVVVSIAAGVLSEDIARWSATDNLAVVRCMPNTPSLLGCGATALFANPHTSESQKQASQSILGAVGEIAWVDNEQQLDAITALSGSGPAYFFLMIEAMIDAGEKLGLTRTLATKFAIQTAYGAARMTRESDTDPAQLRRNVTSPAGTTEAALNTFTQAGFTDIVQQAMNAANDRAAELGKELGEN